MKNKILIFSITIILCLGFFVAKEVKADASDNVWGWAWSENIGWISFNNISGGGAISYGVDINNTTGLFSGYAWSENIGWITFNSAELAGCPSGTCEARVELTNSQISGWARALAAPEAGANSGGWDGWIKLRGIIPGIGDYGARLDMSGVSPYQFHDWVWGGDDNNQEAVVGLISFNCAEGGSGGVNICATKSDYKVMTSFVSNVVPTVNNLQAMQTNGCGGVIERFTWDYSGNPQSAYWLKVFDGAIQVCCSGWTTSSEYQGDLVLDYSKSYTWQLNVRDTSGTESGWTNGPDFNTSGLYPSPNFTWIAVGDDIIRFTNTTTDCSPCSYSWTFQNGSPASSNLETPPDVTFTSAGNVTLIADAGGGRSCQIIKPISSFLPPPDWIEIPPF